MTDQVERFKALEKKRQELQTKKIRLEEQYNAKREALSAIIAEVKKAGYDPKTLKKTIADMETKLKQDIDTFESDLDKASKQLSAIES
jgi:uncharacterized tellurite resistance protein B-like protein